MGMEITLITLRRAISHTHPRIITRTRLMLVILVSRDDNIGYIARSVLYVLSFFVHTCSVVSYLCLSHYDILCLAGIFTLLPHTPRLIYYICVQSVYLASVITRVFVHIALITAVGGSRSCDDVFV